MATLPNRRALAQLRLFTLVLLALNVLDGAANLPAQFGGLGTDAGEEFLTRGTAISAPLLPVVLMLLVVLLASRRDRWGWVAVALAYATAVLVGSAGRRDGRRADGGHIKGGAHHVGHCLADRGGRPHRAGDLGRGALERTGDTTRLTCSGYLASDRHPHLPLPLYHRHGVTAHAADRSC